MKSFCIQKAELDDALDRLYEKCVEKHALIMVFPTQSFIQVVRDNETIAEIRVVDTTDSYEVAEEIFKDIKIEEEE
jgi:glutathione peroxidase-family protein